MRAEVISIGTELLLGHTINSDAAILGRELAALGIDIVRMQTVGDNPGRLRAALELAAADADLIITTGGLGPTDDDLTKAAIAEFAGAPLVEHAESLKRLREYFGSRSMTPNQLRQAWMPKGARVFPNLVGTAPGCALELANGKRIIMLPGPPRELREMLARSAAPYLSSQAGAVILSAIIRTFGIGEGAAAERIKDLMAGANPTVAPYAHGGEMFVKITAKAPSQAEAEAMIQPVAAEIERRLGEAVYGRDLDSLEQAALALLVGNHRTLATAESCTGGLLAKRVTDLPGASAVFLLGVVSYANEAKERVLRVPQAILAEHGAVSPQVARAMAEAVRGLGGADFGIGITGVAGPDGGTDAKPVGLVYIALADAQRTWVCALLPDGRYLGRAWVRERASSIALDMLRRRLAGLPIPASSKELARLNFQPCI